MYLKLTGAILIVVGCGGYGIMMAMNHRKEVNALHQLVRVMEEMICELRRLEEAHKDDFVGTGETNWSLMCYDVANWLEELLKAQEPRLVEPNDFENADDFNWLPAWCEERTGAGYWEMILPDALDEKDVRYWTGRPTQEQMEATQWQIQS
jgi:hypothetical protein